MGASSLEMTKPKLVMAGVQQRGWWDVIGFWWDERELEVQIVEDAVVYCSEVLKLELGGLCSEPLEECNLIVMEIGALEDVEVPLSLLSMSWWVINVASNGGLS